MGTKDYDILFAPNNTSGIVGYTDSEFADYVDNRKSTIGNHFKFGAMEQFRGSQNFRSNFVEAEYISAFDEAKEVLWLGRLAHTFRQVDSDLVLVLYNDNQVLLLCQRTRFTTTPPRILTFGTASF